MAVILWTMADIADRAGVVRQAVALWVKRPDFPPPFAATPDGGKSGMRLWVPEHVEDWLSRNPPRNYPRSS